MAGHAPGRPDIDHAHLSLEYRRIESGHLRAVADKAYRVQAALFVAPGDRSEQGEFLRDRCSQAGGQDRLQACRADHARQFRQRAEGRDRRGAESGHLALPHVAGDCSRMRVLKDEIDDRLEQIRERPHLSRLALRRACSSWQIVKFLDQQTTCGPGRDRLGREKL